MHFPDGYPVTFAPSHFWGLECFMGNSLHKTQDGGGGQNGGTFVLQYNQLGNEYIVFSFSHDGELVVEGLCPDDLKHLSL